MPGYDIAEVDTTKSDIDLATSSNSHEQEYAKAIAMGEVKRGGDTAQPEPTQQPSSDASSQQPAVPPTQPEQPQVPESTTQDTPVKKEDMFNFSYGGQATEYPNGDGFMGKKDLSGLQNGYAHSQEHIKWQSDQMHLQQETARGAIDKRDQELNTLRAERDQLKQQMVSNGNPVHPLSGPLTTPAPASTPLTTIQQPLQQPLVQPPLVQQSPMVQSPVNQQFQQSYQQPPVNQPYQPTKLDLPESAMDWDAEQTGAVSMGLNSMQNEVVSQNQKIADLVRSQQEQNVKQDEYLKRIKQDEDLRAQENQKVTYYDSINKFIDSHEEFAPLKGGILNHENAIVSWMDQNAAANGLQKPLVNDQNLLNDYDQRRTLLANQYLRNDPTVVARSQYVPPPKGAQEYFKLGDIAQKWNTMSDNGKLPFTLEEAYILESHKNGTVQAGTNAAIQAGRQEGADNMAQVMANNQNNAVTISNTATQTAPQVNVTNLSTDEQMRVMNSTTQQLDADPMLKQQYDALSTVLAQKMGIKP